MPNITGSNTSRQPKGLAGWRRANTGGCTVGIVKCENGNAALRFSGRGGYAVLTQTLGESITTGKVCFACDFRMPDKWWWDYHGVYAVLGDAGLWGGANQNYGDHIGARLGIASPQGSSANAFYAHYNTASGSAYDTDVNGFKSNIWYRAVQVVDLDTKKTVGRLYELGANQKAYNYDVSALTPVFERESDLHSTVSEISTFGLAGYGAGNSQSTGVVNREHIYFDNVQIWKDWDATTQKGTLLYRDDFATVTRTHAGQVRGQLVGSYHLDNGQDHWIRRNNGNGDIWITSGENPCVAAVGPYSHSYAIQDLGSCFRGRKVVVQADIRPPSLWLWGLLRAAQIVVGGDGFLNADAGNARDGKFTTKLYAQFGFGNDSASDLGFFNGTKLLVYDGDKQGSGTKIYSSAIDASHWYRFKTTFNLENSTYDVDVYDQGTTHPASAGTPTGTLVKSWKGLGMRTPAEDVGVTSICLNTYGNTPIEPSNPEDPGLALYDNIRVSSPSGMMVLVR